jgi:hypothetical protein
MDVIVQEMVRLHSAPLSPLGAVSLPLSPFRQTSRTNILKNFLAGETGAHLLDPSMKYYRGAIFGCLSLRLAVAV